MRGERPRGLAERLPGTVAWSAGDGVSVAATAVRLARKIFGSLKGKTALIIGAGETGLQTARHLKSEGVADFVLINRTLEKAKAAADGLGARAGGLDELAREIRGADLVIGAVEAPQPLVTPEVLQGTSRNTRCLIDISVPRSMDPEVARCPGVFHFDIDDLTQLIQDAKNERAQEARRSKDIVVAEVHKFLARQHFTGLAPLVEDMRQAFDETLSRVIEKAPADTFAQEARKLSKRLLGVSLNTLKLASRTHVSVEQVRGAYEVFLEENPS